MDAPGRSLGGEDEVGDDDDRAVHHDSLLPARGRAEGLDVVVQRQARDGGGEHQRVLVPGRDRPVDEDHDAGEEDQERDGRCLRAAADGQQELEPAEHEHDEADKLLHGRDMALALGFLFLFVLAIFWFGCVPHCSP